MLIAQGGRNYLLCNMQWLVKRTEKNAKHNQPVYWDCNSNCNALFDLHHLLRESGCIDSENRDQKRCLIHKSFIEFHSISIIMAQFASKRTEAKNVTSFHVMQFKAKLSTRFPSCAKIKARDGARNIRTLLHFPHSGNIPFQNAINRNLIMFPELLCVNVCTVNTYDVEEHTVAHSTHYGTASLSFFLTLALALDKNRLEPDTCHHFFSAPSFVYF